MPPDANRMEPGHAPTPFSAAEIADACRPGRVNVYQLREQGRPPSTVRWEFIGGGAGQGEFVSDTVDEGGAPLGPAQTATARWDDLQRHASTPEDLTTIEVEEAAVPAGTFRCWKYTVAEEDGGHSVSWFALDLPGPPVRRVTIRDGAEVSSMELERHADPRSGPTA